MHLHLRIGTTKFHQDYEGPLVIATLLDSTHYKVRYLENRVLVDIFHINRLKWAFVSTPASTVTM